MSTKYTRGELLALSNDTTTNPAHPRFLDLLPDHERHEASRLFHRAIRRIDDPELAVQLALAWLVADSITMPDAADRLRRLLDTIEENQDLALDYARDVRQQFR